MVILENNKNENFRCQNFNGNCFIYDPLPGDRKTFFKILPDFCHRSDQLYHIWKSPLGDTLIILASIIKVDLITVALKTYIPVYSTSLDKGLSTRKPIE